MGLLLGKIYNMNEFFIKNYRLFLQVANSELGKHSLGVRNDYRIIKITSNSIHQFLAHEKRGPLLQAMFWGSDWVLYKLAPLVEKILIANEYEKGLSPIKILEKYNNRIFLATATLNPQGGEQTGQRTNEPTWTSARDNATSDNTTVYPEAGSLIAGNYYNYRAFEPFTTSSLGSGSTVTAANLQLYRDDSLEFGGNGFKNDQSTSLEIVQSAQASISSYSASDYGSVTFTSKGSLAFSAIGANLSYTTINFSSLSPISTTGNTLIALITGVDLNNTSPSGGQINCFTWQNRASANPTILTVTYTPAAGGAFLFNML